MEGYADRGEIVSSIAYPICMILSNEWVDGRLLENAVEVSESIEYISQCKKIQGGMQRFLQERHCLSSLNGNILTIIRNLVKMALHQSNSRGGVKKYCKASTAGGSTYQLSAGACDFVVEICP